MPLIKSSKPAAFKKNIKTEVAAGKPPKQAVAIAYSEARAAKKKKEPKAAIGGMMALKPVKPTPMKGMK